MSNTLRVNANEDYQDKINKYNKLIEDNIQKYVGVIDQNNNNLNINLPLSPQREQDQQPVEEQRKSRLETFKNKIQNFFTNNKKEIVLLEPLEEYIKKIETQRSNIMHYGFEYYSSKNNQTVLDAFDNFCLKLGLINDAAITKLTGYYNELTNEILNKGQDINEMFSFMNKFKKYKVLDDENIKKLSRYFNIRVEIFLILFLRLVLIIDILNNDRVLNYDDNSYLHNLYDMFYKEKNKRLNELADIYSYYFNYESYLKLGKNKDYVFEAIKSYNVKNILKISRANALHNYYIDNMFNSYVRFYNIFSNDDIIKNVFINGDDITKYFDNYNASDYNNKLMGGNKRMTRKKKK